MTKKNMSGIYTWQRKRVENSLSLVKRAIDELLAEKLRISLTTIVLASKSVDPAGKGVSTSTILRNKQCHELYKKHATLTGSSQKKRNIPGSELNNPTASELRRAYLLASKSKTALIAKVILLERELENCEIQNGNLRNKLLSLQLPHL
ncbi:hypothetical protein HFD95_01805 [Pantoea sp. EKM10T]|uniref:hypothetical protein n=1 Tax=Pantoea sp. EKM10T TaxID=2708058 RepID=UPI00142E847D|nr:hypothetical protein [Pantoea sp. EKM10T]KAF6639383.1 hypothetical protein HFD95_01805 [Pantoea sp. EKM10T]